MLELDGSNLEGGGQLVRVALSLSAITGIPIQVTRIRANRSKHGRHGGADKNTRRAEGKGHRDTSTHSRGGRVEGGLKESHLAALNWLAEQCDADIEGARMGSTEITFRPGKDKKGRSRDSSESSESTIELKNPGSVWLVWQAIFPFLVFGTSSFTPSMNQPETTDPQTFEFTLKGGTNVSKSMSYEYVSQVFLPICEKIGLPPVTVDLVQRGWAGAAPEIGEVKLSIPKSCPLKPFTLPAFTIAERGPISKISISIVAHGLMSEMLQTLVPLALLDTFRDEIELDFALIDDSGDERRLYILLVAHTVSGWRLGRDHLGTGRKPKNDAERRRIVETAITDVVRQLSHELNKGGCVDEYLQDQLVVFQALASGESQVDAGMKGGEGSLHTQTVRWVCEEILGDKVRFEDGGKCIGAGWNREGLKDGEAADKPNVEIEGIVEIGRGIEGVGIT